jgi:hypothetical protein
MTVTLTPPVPSEADVAHIVAIESPVIRNLAITECYARLSAALAQRTGPRELVHVRDMGLTSGRTDDPL